MRPDFAGPNTPGSGRSPPHSRRQPCPFSRATLFTPTAAPPSSLSTPSSAVLAHPISEPARLTVDSGAMRGRDQQHPRPSSSILHKRQRGPPHSADQAHPEPVKRERLYFTRFKDPRRPAAQRDGSLALFNKFDSLSSSSHSSRKWVYSPHSFSGDEDKVIVVSYNILGVENASNHPDLYSEAQSKFLAWDGRRERIHKEISSYNPSIMCFQEVDHFNDINDLFQKDGFEGIYKARTGEASDGCAIFWKAERCRLLHEDSIEFQSFGLRHNVAQFCVLELKNSGSEDIAQKSKLSSSQRLLVGNIHVLYNPKRGDIKLGQIRLFLERACRLSQIWGDIPIVIGGDFNSLPQSIIYQFLSTSAVDIKLHDRTELSGQLQDSFTRKPYQKNSARWMALPKPISFTWTGEEVKLATGSESVTVLQHSLNLSSAYTGVPGSDGTRVKNGEPLATSHHTEFMGTVDYIWHTQELAPVRVLETLPFTTLWNIGGLPSEHWGSDHLALVCELAFVPKPKQRLDE